MKKLIWTLIAFAITINANAYYKGTPDYCRIMLDDEEIARVEVDQTDTVEKNSRKYKTKAMAKFEYEFTLRSKKTQKIVFTYKLIDKGWFKGQDHKLHIFMEGSGSTSGTCKSIPGNDNDANLILKESFTDLVFEDLNDINSNMVDDASIDEIYGLFEPYRHHVKIICE